MSQATEQISKQFANAASNRKAWYNILFNVKAPQYDAAGDGVTDDTAKVQAAVNDAIAAGSKLVYCPPGDYVVTSLTNADQVIFLGDNAQFIGVSYEIYQFGEPNTHFVPQGPRAIIQYQSATGVYIRGIRQIVMGGFRFMGQYTKERGPYGVFGTYPILASTSSDLGAQTGVDFTNWYAVFAVRSLYSDVASVKIMPYLRASSVAGNVVTLGAGGENSDPATLKTYNMANDVLAGAECLVINETISSRVNAFSGRVTAITANTNGSVTLEDVGTIAVGDFLLPAPPGYEHYCYLGTFYVDTAEVRNIADTGTVVATRGSSETRYNKDGALGATGVDVFLGGHISPLATAWYGGVGHTISSASTGSSFLYFGHDNSHETYTWGFYKDVTTSRAEYQYGITVPFAHQQRVNLRSGGALEAEGTRSMFVRGWIEL